MKHVLITPLDWGLGHATRSIPVIRALLKQGCTVSIAGSGDSLVLLQKEFPSLAAYNLPAYSPRYPAAGSMVWAMAKQLPHFIQVIRDEHRALEEIVKNTKVDIVISDNRYGCWSAVVKSIFVTHQSNILMPQRFGWLAPWVRRMNHRMMKRFSLCWIPDLPGDESIAGDLISFGKVDHTIQHRYIGPLSRFEFSGKKEKKYDLLCVFSGPEPQRTIFEKLVMEQVNHWTGKVCIVRGLPDQKYVTPLVTRAEVFPFLNSEALQDAIERSEVMLARSGFSTVMDMSRLGGHAIFIPTPGQTEQVYLAERLSKKGIAYSVQQSKFDLAQAWREVKNYTGFIPSSSSATLLDEAIREILE
ncbi:MAG TPA: glycosyltransferase [Ohtaekwangia sp.]|uniref:glycosyltransferase n=1 Tax=Ohtaekwangia sp. TaxID=2066019 RepID=UPI002F9454CC